MLGNFLLRTCLLLIITSCICVNMQSSTTKAPPKRTTPRTGFFKTLFQVGYEQWTDTRNTLGKINTMLNDNFLPEGAAAATVVTTESSDPNATTTKAPYRISRNELGRILRRNVKGLVRLFNLELDDALKQSRITDKEFNRNASIEFSKFL
ncbi:uncharacterized protein LOC123309570 [Coccinella septempunctata]|uniref:uncharacterized protein LOC123309570 n=1 Tax=Coccinella septempunctata TaxID=41139 RepID=UPI001D08A30C|nr:uncharacterized protein LOC123309570 [Coccinella septempunctata]XP_044748688.1 uncharacterized protein LOC123309570 [Coccinella septempunctata]XP_044748689.1 uncharacterized protein LOC123309570 [Coccinella septempunctata]